MRSEFFLDEEEEEVDGKTEDQEGHQHRVEGEGVREEGKGSASGQGEVPFNRIYSPLNLRFHSFGVE